MLRKCLLLAACTSLSGRLTPPLHVRGGQYGDSSGPGGGGPPQPWDQPPRQQWQPGPDGPQQQPPYGQPPPYGRPQGQQPPQGYPSQGRPQYPPQGQPGQPQQQYGGAPQPQHMQQQRPPQGQQAYGQQPGPPGQYGAPPAFVPTFHDLVRIPARYGAGGRPMLDPTTLPRLDKKQAAALRQPKRADLLALSFGAAADTAELQRSLGVPLGCLIQPLAADAFLIANPRAEEDAAAAAAAAQGGWRAPPPPPLVCRCQTCNGYLNPFATIWPQAAKWECNLCGHVNDLPPPAMPPPPQQQQPQGAGLFGGLWGARGGPEPGAAAPPPLGRPETVHADVEYVLSGEEAGVYSTANDGRPRVLVLALETTRAAAASGALRAACDAAKEALAELAASAATGRAPPRVAIVTFDATARVHRLSEGSAPAVELMLPTADGLPTLPRAAPPPLYDVRERLVELSELLDRLPQQAEAGAAEGAALGAAVEIARSLASDYSGDLVLLSVSGASAGHARGGRELPAPAAAAGAAQQGKAEAKGSADAAAALERLVRAESAPLRELGRACADAQLAVRLVVAPRAPKPPAAAAPAAAPGYPAWGAAPTASAPPPPPFVDVASLAQLPRISGGRLLYVPPTGAGSGAAEHLAAAMKEAMNATHAATDAVLRLRTSKGLQPAGLRLLAGIGTDSDDSILLLPSLDAHATYAAELRHAEEKKPLPPQPAFVQAALLFTAPGGERRIRVSTRRLAVVDNLRAAAQALVPPVALVLRAKLALAAAEQKPLAAVREEIKAALLESVVAQRELCPPPLRKTSDELILFRALALLPLLLTALSSHALLNTPTLSAAATRSPDAVAAQAHGLRALPTNLACLLLLPRVITVHERALGDGWAPGDGAAAPKPAEPPADGAGADAAAASAPAAAAPSAPAEELREVLLPRAAEVSASSVLLVDSLDELTLWVGAQASPPFLERLFGARPADGASLLGAGANGDVDRMHALIASLRAKRPTYAPLRVVVQGSPASDERLLGRLYASSYEPFLFQLIQDQRARL